VTDRELDSLIAERVMGWKVFAGDPGYGRPPGNHPLSLVLDVLPNYSTSIVEAWQVVEKMRGDYELDLSDHVTYWTARFTKARSTSPHVIEAETAPLAICRAALKALEITP